MKNLINICLFLFLIGASYIFAQDVELIFSHELHAELEAQCIDCHAVSETSMLPSDNLLPEMETCYQCHDEDAACTMCHKDPDNAVPYPRIINYIAKFPHETHVKSVECNTCHESVSKSSSIFDNHLPDMATCINCHSDKQTIDYCYVCHQQGEELAPVDHKMDWDKAHGITSYTQSDDCQICHTENQCLECHQGDNLDRNVHAFNFKYNHAISAKGAKDNCITCHEEQQFCADCHRQELVLPKSHSYVSWSNTTTGGKHAREAKMDFDSCISCHNESMGEPICAECHQ